MKSNDDNGLYSLANCGHSNSGSAGRHGEYFRRECGEWEASERYELMGPSRIWEERKIENIDNIWARWAVYIPDHHLGWAGK